jgi:hypothetical protein
MQRTPKEKKQTSLLLLLGTALVSFAPLYITRFHAAIDDGGLLLIASRRQLEQSCAVNAFVHGNSTAQLLDLQRNTLNEEQRSSETLPNDSILLLISSLLIDASVVLWIQD